MTAVKAVRSALEAERFEDPIFRLFYPELEVVYQEKNDSLDDPGERELDATLRNLFPRHPYGTQTIFGETEHLKLPAYHDMAAYYERWYVPNNMAVLLAGDIDAAAALPVLERTLGRLQPARFTTAQTGEGLHHGRRQEPSFVVRRRGEDVEAQHDVGLLQLLRRPERRSINLNRAHHLRRREVRCERVRQAERCCELCAKCR